LHEKTFYNLKAKPTTMVNHEIQATKKQFVGKTSLCFTDQATQEAILLGGPTPL